MENGTGWEAKGLTVKMHTSKRGRKDSKISRMLRILEEKREETKTDSKEETTGRKDGKRQRDKQ